MTKSKSEKAVVSPRTKVRKQVVKDTVSADNEVFYVRIPLTRLTGKGNPGLSSLRIKQLTTNIISVWIKRFVLLGHPETNFGIDEKEEELVVWFKYEFDAKRCQKMFDEISDFGVPSSSKWDL